MKRIKYGENCSFFYHFSNDTSQCRFEVVFSFISENVKMMKIIIEVKNIHFYHISQATSDCHFLGSLFSFRKRKNHENNESMVTCKRNSFFITFHKLCQTVTFWGRDSTSETVKNMKRIKPWWKMLIFITFHKLRQTVTFCGRYLASESVQ